ncbi:DMT family transporter [Streptomyces sp. AC555_RSS877]|uniref:DMT family transporter n=1 Tax=Streptomyces sp. AC555_RSS877 TaxID=2823688 RepID=UPI001C269A5A|nr:DMT family transporter [Streptomyces sp. AC555_RSS877]
MAASPVFLAVALSLISAICYATAAVVQERTAANTASVRGALLRSSWWWAVALNATGALLHVVALRYGPLTLVQPLGALSLVVAVPLGSMAAGRRTSVTQWQGMALTLVGLTALLTVTASGSAPQDSLGGGEILLVSLAAAAVVAALVRFASDRSSSAGLALAAASGISSGVGSTLAQKLVVGPTLSWSVALVAALTVPFAVAGLLLSQKAYRSGLGGPLALLTLVNPVTASAIGIGLLGEGFRYGGTGTVLALAGAGAAMHGVTLLSRPQPVHGRRDPQRGDRDHRRLPHRPAPESAPGPRPVRLLRSGAPSAGLLRPVSVDMSGTSRAI